ncbi:mechanosensitive ion channel family protein [Pelagibaculum spongiae]|uniref:Mechanosensitive ion channel protein MscS n=1 Tax=Pelagibaculum spongiae TaxID=2080658 RepID=A0A2V1H0Q2_9GAMM|nr:mechanosensitive ion channel family protein [Pelagibaculum spongiae]PVZ68879.1 mechanosensitive ion channel protein MscS [Pelagibaculum spongiae]
MEQLQSVLTLIPGWGWQVLVILFVTFLTAKVIPALLDRFATQLKKTKNSWDETLIEAMILPLKWLVWIIGFSMMFMLLSKQYAPDLQSLVARFRIVGSVAMFGWFLLKLIKPLENTMAKRSKFDQTGAQAVGKLLRAVVIVVLLLMLMQNLGFSVSGLLAFGGVGGIAIGFAAKDLLSNFFGGLMIYLDRPFKIGDWIRSPDRNIEGTVEYIGWRQTRIRTFDKRPLYIPNGVFSNISIENPSRMHNRRINETIGLRYQDWQKIPQIIEAVTDYLKNNPDIDATQTLIVNFNQFAPSSLDFFIYTFTKTTDWVLFHQIKQKVLLDIMQIIDQHGAEMAFPSQSVYIESLPENLSAAQANQMNQ